MRKQYHRPEMVAYGDLRFVTQGASGVNPDLDINKQFEIIGPDTNPTCTTNVTFCFNLLSV
jgi:hypothetical protein